MADTYLKEALKDANNLERIAPTKIGASNDNCFEVPADGAPRLRGTSTVWADMIGDLYGKRLYSNTGRVDYDYDENAIKFQNNGSITNRNDRIGANIEVNHQFKVGTGMVFKPHIHWFQEVTSGSVNTFVLTMQYRFQRNNHAKTTAWTTIALTAGTDDIFDFTGESDGIYNQISKFPDITIDCAVSDTFQFRMARTDSVSGDMRVYFMDLHGLIDSQGSEEEYEKD